jgi:hypothetical protein
VVAMVCFLKCHFLYVRATPIKRRESTMKFELSFDNTEKLKSRILSRLD